MIPDFENKLRLYAEIIIKIGLNIQPGQRLFVRAPVEHAPLVRLLSDVAYQTGSSLVHVHYGDPYLSLSRLQYAPDDSLEEIAQWEIDARTQAAKNGDAIASLYSENPELMAGQDSERITTRQRAVMRASRDFSEMIGKNATPWCIFSAPSDGWNQQVFPDLSAEDAEDAMWKAIFAMCRIDQPDPVAAWQAHIKDLNQRAAYLTAKGYDRLHYRAPGADLTIGLPQNHRWVGAGSTSLNDIYFVANMPTEEVFTLPHRERVDGYVTSTKPLNAGGETLRNFTLTFEAGRVVKVSAKQGETRLNQLLDTDANARRLGEVALVPHSSPISQTGLVFNNGLIDENASCHLALGSAYYECLDGSLEMSEDEFAAAGGNNSDLHMDFMIGSGELDIDGITVNGDTEPVMRNGEWAYSV